MKRLQKRMHQKTTKRPAALRAGSSTQFHTMRPLLFGAATAGECDVCGHWTTHVARDTATGWRVGECCLTAVISAEKFMATCATGTN